MGNTMVTLDAVVDHVPEDKYTELLLGSGVDHRKQLVIDDRKEWSNLVTLDVDPSANPDVTHDLNDLPYPFNADTFDEIHAYQVLEHCGTQGDWRFFFAQFAEFHRILKPGGLFYAAVPSWDSVHAFGDPGHTRVINETTLHFLVQKHYGVPPMTDYRSVYKCDFSIEAAAHKDENFIFCLRKQ